MRRHDTIRAVIDWRALLAAGDGMEMPPAASAADVTATEAALGTALPIELRELYAVTNGVFDTVGQWFVVWQLAEVVARNRTAWAVESTARSGLIGFGDDGTGAAFCIPTDGSGGVFVWNPIDSSAERLAETVEAFWLTWIAGEITT
jgi:cell wall assembly regulator SMI1